MSRRSNAGDGLVADFVGFRVSVVGTLIIWQGSNPDERFLWNRDQADVLAKFFQHRDVALTKALIEAVSRTKRAASSERDGEMV